MADTVSPLAARVHELLVDLMTGGPSPTTLAGLHDAVARASALGPDGAWLAATALSTLGTLDCVQGRTEQGLRNLDAAVTAGFNDCVSFHVPHLRPLYGDPRFQALYRRMRITAADLDELFWLHQEMQVMSREAQDANVDNIGRLDTGVTLLPKAPLPTREPDTPGILCTRLELAAVQTALQQAALKADFQRSSGNTALDLIDGPWDLPRARYDARHADELDERRQRASEARAFVERPGADRTLSPCPPLGSITYPA